MIAADWSSVYPECDGEAKFYVYAHVYPYGNHIKHDGKFKLNLPGMPFYIGKGVGDRAWDLKRNEGHGVALRELRARGFGKEKIVHLLAEGLTESKAFEIEAKLISFFGTKFQSERKGVLLNLDMPKTLNY